ncbi:hypothetical protein BDW69DRAFT_136947 [Aspergillus filifer]
MHILVALLPLKTRAQPFPPATSSTSREILFMDHCRLLSFGIDSIHSASQFALGVSRGLTISRKVTRVGDQAGLTPPGKFIY